jgi:hypothetical protein
MVDEFVAFQPTLTIFFREDCNLRIENTHKFRKQTMFLMFVQWFS